MASDVLLTFRRTRCVGWKNGIASVLELLQVSGSQRTLLSVSLEWEHREILNGLYQGTMLFALLKRNTQDTLSPQGNVGLLQAPPAGCWGRGECGFKSTGSCLPVILVGTYTEGGPFCIWPEQVIGQFIKKLTDEKRYAYLSCMSIHLRN